MTTVHVHVGRARPEVVWRGVSGYAYRFRDAGSLRSLYDDLAERMWRARRDLLALHPTGDASRFRDDLEGHAFHGNQHTGGISGPHKAKPTTHSQKTAKAAVHELLSSGHAFTKEELMSVAGVKTEKLFADYMAMLKNPKYAGPKGALSIGKTPEGMYYVAMPDGAPAPPPDAKLDLSKPKGHDPSTAAAVSNLIAAAQVAPAFKLEQTTPPEEEEVPNDPPPSVPGENFGPPDDELLEPEPGMPEYVAPKASDPEQSALAKMKGAHPGSMPKSEADALYEKHVDAAYSEMQELLTDGLDHADSVLAFKTAKAHGMAAWAQAVHGGAFAPKPQQVYKADLALAKGVEDGQKTKAQLLAEWKNNTKLEKVGHFPAKPAGVPQGPAPHPAPDAPVGMSDPVPLAPFDYHALAPHGATDIAADDITAGRFSKGIQNLQNVLLADSKASASQNKATVEQRLRERLKDSPNFQALNKRLGLAKEGHGSLEARLISQWASSSGDHHDLSVSLQVACRDAFGIPDSHIEKAALGALGVHGGDEAKMVASGIHSLNGNMKKLEPHEVPVAKAALQEFVRAQYAETQEFLKAKGMSHVYLARGMKVHTNHHAAFGPASLKLQPASSFSAQYSTAKSFAGSGTVFLVKVPREQVLSTYMTGFGCTGEHEVVVLAHEKLKAYSVPSSAASSATGAQEHVHSQLQQHAKATGVPIAAAAPSSLEDAKKAAINAASKASKMAAKAKQQQGGSTLQHHYATKAAAYKQEAEAKAAVYKAMKKGAK